MKKLFIWLIIIFPFISWAQNYNVLYWAHNGEIVHAINIKTQIPMSVDHSPKIHIDGFDYMWGAFIIDLNWNTENGYFVPWEGASSSGGFAPQIYLYEDSGKVRINLAIPGGYNPHLYITGHAEEGTDSSFFTNWTVTDEDPTVSQYFGVGYGNTFGYVAADGLYANSVSAGTVDGTALSSHGTIRNWDYTGGSVEYSSAADNNFSQNAHYNSNNNKWTSYNSKAAFGNAVVLQTQGKEDKAFNILVDTSVSAPNEELTFSNLLTIKTDGKTGLGSPDPKEILQVNGNVVTTGNNKGYRFNCYDSSGNKYLSQGFAAALTLDSAGNLLYANTNTSGSPGAAATFNKSFSIDKDGKVYARKVKVTLTGWPDYVFAPDYMLPDLKEVERFIQLNKHLPDVPSAREIEQDGNDIGETQAILIRKIEELTLYIIDLNKKVEQLTSERDALKH